MKKNHIKSFKIVTKLVVIAFLFACLDLLTINALYKSEISMAISTLKPISDNEVVEEDAIIKVLGDDSKLVKNYPNIGQAYGNISIPGVGIDLPIYYGDSVDILKNGIGQMVKSCLPGEGKSIVLGGNNTNIKFGKLKDLKLDDTIVIDTDYGKFNYKIYEFKVINEIELNLLLDKKNQEVLILYTNYPFEYYGYTTKRYVVYANLLNYEIKEVN